MATMTIRLPDAKHQRLRLRAGTILNKMVEDWAGTSLAQFDAETRFRARASRGIAQLAMALLDKLEQAQTKRSIHKGKGRAESNS